ncbi:MAG: asparagine synthase C-terminal domain-containing protein [Halobacteriaceae archaeon]
MIRGISELTATLAIKTRDPLPGTAGFAGQLSDGRLMRDILGRYPLFIDPENHRWGYQPADMQQPHILPPGTIVTQNGLQQIWPLPRYRSISTSTGISRLETILQQRLADIPTEDAAIGFSGGVDSALIAQAVDVPCYTIGFPGSSDFESARKAKQLLDINVRFIEITHDDILSALPRVVNAIHRTDPMDVSIALSLYLLAKGVYSAGYTSLILGQGVDELFGGYDKIANAKTHSHTQADSTKKAHREVIANLPSQLVRDQLAIQAANVSPEMPFIHDDLAKIALSLPANGIVTDTERKVAFRHASRSFLPDRLAFNKKTAIQYGSYVTRELDRLARENGFKRNMSNHIEKFIQEEISPNFTPIQQVSSEGLPESISDPSKITLES